MNEIKDSGPAFPEVPGDCNGYEGKPGMTLRDYFAAKAMAACLTYAGTAEVSDEPDEVASIAYLYADAMLRARGVA